MSEETMKLYYLNVLVFNLSLRKILIKGLFSSLSLHLNKDLKNGAASGIF
ncbi:MAG: hypothetical protein ACW98D_11860 [Promethearchaeota archaeon]